MFTLGARARLSLGTNVNTPFFQGLTPEFGHKHRARIQGLTLYSGTKVGVYVLGTQCLNTAPFRAGAQALVLGHQVWTWPRIAKRSKFSLRVLNKWTITRTSLQLSPLGIPSNLSTLENWWALSAPDSDISPLVLSEGFNSIIAKTAVVQKFTTEK